jgi:predicted nucleic acid-binding protein
MREVRVFIDTNVLLYVHDRREAERQKAISALAWLRRLTDDGIATTNLQVLNELTHSLLRKKWFESVEAVHAIVDSFADFGDSGLTWTEVVRARALQSRYQFSWWDCLLLASAIELGCTHFLSEDLKDGQTIEGLTILSPFAHTPDQILVSR